MPVIGYIVRRAATLLIVVFAITVITFFITRMLPGDPAARIAGIGTTPEQIAAVRESLGLDRPLGAQFLSYLWQLARFDLGTSIATHKPIAEEIAGRFPATMELTLFAVVLYTTTAIAVGLLTAATRTRWLADLLRIATIIGSSVPPYWVALVLQLLFYSWIGILPSGQRLSYEVVAPPTVTGFYTIDSLLSGQWATLGSALAHLVLPVLSLVIGNVGSLARLVRAQAIDEFDADYVRTIRAKGVGRAGITLRHVLPNSVNPTITVIGMQVGFLLAGTVFIEKVFQWPGLGSYTWDAVLGLDYPAITASAIVLSVIFVVVSFAVDLVYQLVDPRLRVRG